MGEKEKADESRNKSWVVDFSNIDESMNSSSKKKEKNKIRVNGLAFVCCVAAFWFNCFCFMYQRLKRCRSPITGGDWFEPVFSYLAIFPIMLGGVTLFVKTRTMFLDKRIRDQNLVDAFFVDEHGDMESWLVGTELHRKTAVDITAFSFASWFVGYAVTLVLGRFFGAYMYAPTYVLKGLMVCFFGLSSSMNLRVLAHTRLKMYKLNRYVPTDRWSYCLDHGISLLDWIEQSLVTKLIR